MGAAFNIVNRICVRIYLVAKPIVIHQSNVHNNGTVTAFVKRLPRKTNGVWVQRRLIFVKVGDVLANSIIELKAFTFTNTLIFQVY